ncbi:MAG: polyprenyl synthetase family protein [Desulfobacterales bacterium]
MSDLKTMLLEWVRPDLEQIEASLRRHLVTNFDLVSKVASHLLFSGGKRLRPLLLIMSARICGYRGGVDVDLATAFEYLHTATLLHDDLVDGAGYRRGRPVAHQLWDNPTAVLVGDYLFARASSIAAATEHLDAIKVLAEVTQEMSQGELFQLTKKGNIDLTEDEYLEVIRRKTAVLFQGACRIGASLHDAGNERKSALDAYGLHLGLAFQMADDMLDYLQQDIETLGKAAGADLREGKVTLPVIHTLRQAAPSDKAAIKSILAQPDFTTKDFKRIMRLMETYGGMAYTRKKAEEHSETAKDALCVFPQSKTREIMTALADYALIRKA